MHASTHKWQLTVPVQDVDNSFQQSIDLLENEQVQEVITDGKFLGWVTPDQAHVLNSRQRCFAMKYHLVNGFPVTWLRSIW